ncbi:MAG: DNA mismatch repair protein MutS [Candidatus Marinimicrobia bacterium]|jgi:DNA mismatch repair protein MutS|nr:DNA mismatch repair protein MutS [Candidatus Neomarinimicrobiota bacterium]MBT3618391.1 DNA mismatch repair protein MutS [Candidatus Neomarinimicrobiota bacterium]MBT3829186.1 DNA mismatch repair protein MutS [Candidatus Neomarinimicrobiota bacterium]MBT3998154.1 DNA mismatch repair protein MutS [Candidatus Neomarinimicrobiota bacterium]MBT4281495.1 DNA mismatch repair protein MutS [Candidatus Neomarinimicrobiota bacterium]
MAKSKPQSTPLMRQFDEIKRQHTDSILLFRMGDFYETFAEDAKTVAKILGIVLTKRSNGVAGEVPLAGFPYHALDQYLPKLVKAGHRVAICEQVEDPKLAKGIVKREVTEVVTPGTITSDQTLNEKSNRFLGALAFEKKSVGFAFLDASTGEFFLGESPRKNLLDILRKFSPHEIVVAESVTISDQDWYIECMPFISRVEDWAVDKAEAMRILTDHFKVKSLKGFGCSSMDVGITAGGMIFHHVEKNLNGNLSHVSAVRPIRKDGLMNLDAFTVRNLEIFASLATQGTHGTLIDVLDETNTAGGGRLLRSWLYRPLTDLLTIQDRHNAVEGFVQDKNRLSDLRSELKELTDLERALGKLSKHILTPRELFGFRLSLDRIPGISLILKDSSHSQCQKLSETFKDVSKITEEINTILADDPPAKLSQIGVIRNGVNAELDDLRALSTSGKQWIADLQSQEREKTGINSLKIGFNRVFGYFIEVTKANQDLVPEDYIRKQTLVNSERYITPDLKEYEEKILSADERICEIESKIYFTLCDHILSEAKSIQVNAHVLNRLDVLSTFAQVAIDHHYCKPEMVEENVINLNESRHPVVEQLLPVTDRFVPNDLKMDSKTSQIHLITGPNMAGKSTYLRQIGQIVLMAQIGSFVPAKSAKLGIRDQLFTRVGASDNLAGGESTFLVEMNETANILNNATKQSLVLLDEIGRGTATFDGLSLAWAITEYLHNTDECASLTLFATHYHELTDLEHALDRLQNYHAAVKEFGDKIIFLRKILPGPGDESYGIHVAKMAGLPMSVISRATEILSHHIRQQTKDGTAPNKPASNQQSLFEKKESELQKDIEKMSINTMTPLEALETLDKLKKKHGL